VIAIWYAVVSFMLIVYVVLDGRNFGAGMLHWLVARTPEERRQVIAAIGPLWTWHEVWLLGFGGTLIAIFPRLMASAFAGYYLALFLILWCLILRGISLEVGGHINDRLWQAYWDFIFVVSNFLLAILFGAAAGNVARGVPVDAQGDFSMAFFTNFNVRGHVGLLDWYTVSIAILAVVMLAAHGATYLTLKTATQTVALQEQNARKATEELAFAEERYKVGASTFLDVVTSRGTFARSSRTWLRSSCDRPASGSSSSSSFGFCASAIAISRRRRSP